MNKKGRNIWLLRIAVIYMLFQLFWWAFQLTQLHQEVYEQELRIELLNGNAPDVTQDYLQRKMWMIGGEALVFIAIISYLFFSVRKAYLDELKNIQQQKNFILSTTHELKTPITSNKLLLETLLRHQQLPAEKQNEIIQKALKENARLEKLIENLLFVGSMDQSNFHLEKSPVDLYAILNKIKADYIADIKIHLTPFQFTFLGDAVLLESVFRNLIENAIKYNNNPEKELWIDYQASNDLLIFKDNGIGIAKEDLKSVFNLFFRSGDENTRKTKGTGIGLYLCKQILKLHDVDIKVESKNDDGASFIISF